MENALEKKLRKFFRKEQKKNFWLGFKGDELEIFNKLPLNAYDEFEAELTDYEFYDLQAIFKTVKKQELLFSLIPSDRWFDRCWRNLRLFDSLSDEQLEKIINDNYYGIFKFFRGQWSDRRSHQHRIIRLLHQDRLESCLSCLSSDEFSTFNEFLIWEIHRDEKDVYEQEESTRIFEKMASLSDATIATLLEKTEDCVAKRILEHTRKLERSQVGIYQNIPTDNLYNVLEKTDFDLLDNAEAEIYSWVYDHIDERDKDDFCRYLVDEKRSEMEVFDAKICVRIYYVLDLNQFRDFVKEIFTKNGSEAFEKFYEEFQYEDEEKLFEILLEDEEGRKIIDFLLNTKPEEDLSLLERLIKEKYVTQK